LGEAGNDLKFEAYPNERSMFRYDMHTLPGEVSSAIGTSTLFCGVECRDLRGADRRSPLD
jgi:hypothetical protein